ncbi:hypothetical protein BH10PSE13_BH10PSE13_14340 [soil metagenome]
MKRGGWTYIITNKPRGVLYVGVTAEWLPASTSTDAERVGLLPQL